MKTTHGTSKSFKPYVIRSSCFTGKSSANPPATPCDLTSQGLRLETQRLTPSSIEFDLIGVDASIANSLRRTLIAEVPTIAIESVYVYNNTSIMQDEVLAHRLGLLPIKFDPRLLNWKPKQVTGADGSGLDLSGSKRKVLPRLDGRE